MITRDHIRTTVKQWMESLWTHAAIQTKNIYKFNVIEVSFCFHLSNTFIFLTIPLTGTPGIAEEDKFAKGALLLAVLSEHTQLELVAAHWGRRRGGDEDGRTVEVQAFWVCVGFPVGGWIPLGESDWHYDTEVTWAHRRGRQVGINFESNFHPSFSKM